MHRSGRRGAAAVAAPAAAAGVAVAAPGPLDAWWNKLLCRGESWGIISWKRGKKKKIKERN